MNRLGGERRDHQPTAPDEHHLRRGDLATVRAELAAGVPIDDGDRYGASALFKAAAAGHLEIGEPLMASPAISEGTLYLRTPSHLYALRAGPSSTGRPAGD